MPMNQKSLYINHKLRNNQKEESPKQYPDEKI